MKPRGKTSAARTEPERKRPFICLAMLMSADGKIGGAKTMPFAGANWVEHRKWLAKFDGILLGARAAESCGASLLPPRARMAKAPVVIIVSERASVDPGAKVFQGGLTPFILLHGTKAARHRLKKLQPRFSKMIAFKDLRSALHELCHAGKMRRLVCAGGGTLNAALLDAGLVDEIRVTILPLIAGDRNAPTLADGLGARKLADAIPLEWTARKRRGSALILTARVGR